MALNASSGHVAEFSGLLPALHGLVPMDPSPCLRAFTDPAWAFTLPVQGCRLLAAFGQGDCRLMSRRGIEGTRWFPEIAAALTALRGGWCVVDGEVAMLDTLGRIDPQGLHERAVVRHGPHDGNPLVYVLRDVLVHDGCDVRHLPWLQRQRRLRRLPLSTRPNLMIQPWMQAEGHWLFTQAVALRRPELHGHRLDGRYHGGCSADWITIACPVDAPVSAGQE